MGKKLYYIKWYDEDGWEHDGVFTGQNPIEAKTKALKKYDTIIHYFAQCVEIKRTVGENKYVK